MPQMYPSVAVQELRRAIGVIMLEAAEVIITYLLKYYTRFFSNTPEPPYLQTKQWFYGWNFAPSPILEILNK